MRRISLWVLSTVSTLVLLFGYSTSTSGPSDLTTPPSAQSGTYSSGSNGSSGSTGAQTVTGRVAATRWGPVQVALTVAGGKITGVQVLQYPSGSSRDAEINDRALPILTQETLAAQGSSIDMVSGATVTSGGYLQSLQSALDQAGL